MFKVARPKENLFDVGRYITLKLKENHTTIYQLAKNTGLSRAWVYKMLKRKDWTISHLLQFSEYLK